MATHTKKWTLQNIQNGISRQLYPSKKTSISAFTWYYNKSDELGAFLITKPIFLTVNLTMRCLNYCIKNKLLNFYFLSSFWPVYHRHWQYVSEHAFWLYFTTFLHATFSYNFITLFLSKSTTEKREEKKE